MEKLYPPIISGTLPAFYLEESNMDRIIKITVPFTMNSSVGASQIKGFALRIKTVQNSNQLYTAQTTDNIYFNLEGSSYVTFVLKTSNNTEERELILRTLKIGLFYKIQIAYIDNNGEIGNFSTVGISKYTTKPNVYIQNLKTNLTNTHLYDYIGVYSQENGDSTEKVYSYCFNLYDENDNLIATSGDQVHNTTIDTNLYESYDTFSYNKDFELYKPYKIQYSIITNNNLSIQSPLYRINQKLTIDSDINATIVAKTDFNNGYIQIDLIGNKNNEGKETPITGSFVLSRATQQGGYSDWEKLSTFKIISQYPTRTLWRDFTAEQGKRYKYSLQQYNDNGLYSNRLISNIVFSDFEDIFLYDGERQLKIRYNPKIGNIKTNLQETKTDTLGSKYPFFFRNGNVNYKEFTISGLLSYLEDEKFFFISKEELQLKELDLYRNRTKSIDVLNLDDPVSLQFERERLFKTKVLDWLNNGKPKIYRSPTEGNFIVRMMKTTLNPENKLGRLLHTFNGTAYEIADYTYENLIKYNFVSLIKNEDIQFLSWKTIEFKEKDKNGKIIYPYNKILNDKPTNSIQFLGMRPGQMVKLTFENTKTETIVIGATGSYNLNSKILIEKIELLESNLFYSDNVKDPYLTGSLTYSFLGLTPNIFEKISMVENISFPCVQFIGHHEDILRDIQYVKKDNLWVKHPKHELLKIFNIKTRLRDIVDVYNKNGSFYFGKTDIKCDIENMNPLTLLRVGSYLEVPYSPTHSDWIFTPEYYYDCMNKTNINLDDYKPYVYINGNERCMLNSYDFDFFPDTNLKTLSCGNGVVVEVSYCMKCIDFYIEDDDNYPAYEAKQNYLEQKNKLDKFYEIMSILGKFQGSELLVETQKDILINQINNDLATALQPYKELSNTIENNFKIISENNEKAHKEKMSYIIKTKNSIMYKEVDKVLNFKDNIYYKYDPEKDTLVLATEYEEDVQYYTERKIFTENEKQMLYQLVNAEHVENYEFSNILEARTVEKDNTINSIDNNIQTIEKNFQEEIEYINDQSAIQLATIKNNKNLAIQDSIAIFEADENLWKNNLWVENQIKDLKKKTDKAYNDFILALIESQEMQAQEEIINDN